MVRPFKMCTCGRTFDARAWAKLALCGTLEDDAETLELRNCPCGSTLAIVLAVAHREAA